MERFTWIDGERLVRFGAGSVAEAPALLAERGFDGYALLATERARAVAPGLAAGAAVVLDVPGGRVADVAAGLLDAVGERPLVGLGGGRSIDTAKAIGAGRGGPVAGVPATLAGAGVAPPPPPPPGAPGGPPAPPPPGGGRARRTCRASVPRWWWSIPTWRPRSRPPSAPPAPSTRWPTPPKHSGRRVATRCATWPRCAPRACWRRASRGTTARPWRSAPPW